MTIDVLPDDVLVEIFFYVNIREWDFPNPWHTLVHVCRKWRYVVFGSPRRLDLRLEYEGNGPMSEIPDAWKALPVILMPMFSGHPKSDQQWDNVIAALESELSNRTCEINIYGMTYSRWGRFAAAMQKPFPELTDLQVELNEAVLVLPDSFLGGSAPRLRSLELDGIPLPTIPELLSSANGLVTLSLWDIPDSGYFSPNAMATALSAMTRLESFLLGFRSLRPFPIPNPTSRSQPPATRRVLPALTSFTFKGVSDYSEVLLSRIDAPLLYDLTIIFFMDFDFDVPQLHRFIGHAKEFKACDLTAVEIFSGFIVLTLRPKLETVQVYRRPLLELHIMCGRSDWQLPSLAQVCDSSFSVITAVEELEIRESNSLSSFHWKDDMEIAQWLELLGPFTSLKNLYLTHGIAQRVCDAIQELSGETATEVLPTLRNVFIDGSQSFEHIQEAIRPFIAARQLSGHPVTINYWRR